MRKYSIMPVLAVIAGAAGAYLRTLQLKTGFEAETGLEISGDMNTIGLIVLTGILAVCFILLLLRKKTCAKEALSLGKDRGVFMLLAGIALGGAIYFRLTGGVLPLIDKFFLAATAICAICTIARGVCVIVGKDSAGLALIPVFFSCFWLVMIYKEQAANPVILDYVFQVGAAICGVLGLYLSTGVQLGLKRIKPAVFFSLMGVYFSILVLPETGSLDSQLIYLFNIFYLFTISTSLLNRRITQTEE